MATTATPTMTRPRASLASLCAPFLLMAAGAATAGPLDGGWRLDGSASSLRFQSIKNGSTIETSSFATFSGEISETGDASIRVALESVDTGVDLRNVRMRFLFFETFLYPEAEVTLSIEPSAIATLEADRRVVIPLDYQLNLHGLVREMTSDVVVTLLGPDRVSVRNDRPIQIALADFNLDEGRMKLEDAAEVTIVPAASVSFDFVFARNEGDGGGPLVATAEPEAAPVATRAALENAGDFSRDACVGRFEIVSRAGGVNFASGSATLRPESGAALAAIADIVRRCPGLALEIGGHTDSLGGAALNQRLSEARARAVADWLARAGVAPARLEARGYGESRPAHDNGTPRGRALNRRIEFAVLDEG